MPAAADGRLRRHAASVAPSMTRRYAPFDDLF
jgi:hypothetical protein